MKKKIVAVILGLEVSILTSLGLFYSLLLWIITGLVNYVCKLSLHVEQAFDIGVFVLICAFSIFCCIKTVDRFYKAYLILTILIPLLGLLVYFTVFKEPNKASILEKELAKSSSGIAKPQNYNLITCSFEKNLKIYYDSARVDRNNLFLRLFRSSEKNILLIKVDTIIFSNDYKYAYVQYIIKQPNVYYAESSFCFFTAANQMELIPGSIYSSFDDNQKNAIEKIRYDAFIASRKRLKADYSNDDYKTYYENVPSPIDKNYWTKTFPIDSVNMRVNGSLKIPINCQ